MATNTTLLTALAAVLAVSAACSRDGIQHTTTVPTSVVAFKLPPCLEGFDPEPFMRLAIGTGNSSCYWHWQSWCQSP